MRLKVPKIPSASVEAATALHDVLMVPFYARRLTYARVQWINRRWMSENGVDIFNPRVVALVEQWLLREFAFCVPAAGEPEPAYGQELKVFFADRYGTTGLAPHGGSGRAGTSHGFQVKGIGATPLVGTGADWHHSHGCAWMEECVREAIYSEIAHAKFPLGAIPTIAILDTGLNHQPSVGKIGERRALMIRPFEMRPAHLQRAPMFKPARSPAGCVQWADALRTKSIIRYLAEKHRGNLQQPLELLFSNIGRQVAFGHVHRFYNGGYFSSNMTLDGALLDFGSMTTIPGWRPHRSNDLAVPFGMEAETVRSISESLTYYVQKYVAGTNATPLQDDLFQSYEKGYGLQMQIECVAAVRIESNEAPNIIGAAVSTLRDSILTWLRPIPGRRALRSTNGNDGQDDKLNKMPLSGELDLLLERLEATLKGEGEDGDRRAARIHSVKARLATRPDLERSSLQNWIFDTILPHDPETPADGTVMSQAIESKIAHHHAVDMQLARPDEVAIPAEWQHSYTP